MATTIVGRDFELTQLLGAVDGPGGVVLVSGEAGIGKSRLVGAARDAALERARPNGLLAVTGSTSETGGALPYWPWIQVVRSMLAASDVADLVARAAKAFGGAWATAPADDEPAATRFALFDGVTSALVAASSRRPLLIILEDLHAADAPSLLLLQVVQATAGSASITIVGTYRPSDARQRPATAELLDQVGARAINITLGGLGAADLGRLAKVALDVSLREELTTAIHAATSGNPLHALEVVRLMAGRDELETWSPVAPLPVPDGVRAVLRTRMASLAPETTRVLQIAAIAGTGVIQPVLAARVAGLDVGDVVAHLVAAASVDVVRLTGDEWAFRHSLLRDAVIESLGPVESARLHLQVANAIEQHEPDTGERDAALAHHHASASPIGDAATAAVWCARAAARAFEQVAYEEAVAWMRRAVDLAPTDTGNALRVELLIRLRRYLWAAGAFDDVAVVGSHALELARAHGDPAWRAEAALACLNETSYQTDWNVVAELEAVEPLITDVALRARVLAGHAAAIQWDRRSGARRIGLIDRAVALARKADSPNVLFDVLRLAQYATWYTALDQSDDLVPEMGRLANRLGDPLRQMHALCWSATLAQRRGDGVGFRQDVQALRALADEAPLPVFVGSADLFQTALHLSEGHLNEGQRLLDRRDALTAGLRNHRAVAQGVGVQQSQIARRRLDIDLMRLVRAGIDDRLVAWSAASPWLPGAYMFDILTGDTERGRAGIIRILEALADIPDDANRVTTMAMLAEACDLLDLRGPHSDALYDALLPWRGTFVVIGPGWEVYSPVDQQLGQLCRLRGSVDEGVAHFEDALSRLATFDAPSTEAITRHYFARLLASVPDRRKRAEEQRRLARKLADRCEMEGWLTTIDGGSVSKDADVAAFRRDGDVWTISYRGRTVRVPNSKGVGHLAVLAGRAGQDVPALVLAGGWPEADVGAVLDDQAKAAYRRRIDQLRAVVGEASDRGDLVAAERAQNELDEVLDHLSKAVGLGGRDRRPGSAGERARVNVTRAIRSAIDRVTDLDPELGRHLDETVRTGAHCSYRPAGVQSH